MYIYTFILCLISDNNHVLLYLTKIFFTAVKRQSNKYPFRNYENDKNTDNDDSGVDAFLLHFLNYRIDLRLCVCFHLNFS